MIDPRSTVNSTAPLGLPSQVTFGLVAMLIWVIFGNGPVSAQEVEPAGAPPTSLCYAVADGTTEAADEDALDTLTILDRATGSIIVVGGGIGNTGRYDIEAIAIDGSSGQIYASDAGQLGRLDATSGRFEPRPLAYGMGRGYIDGVLTQHRFLDVDSLSFDPRSTRLFGSDRRDVGLDLLLQIDPETGSFVPGAFPDPTDPSLRVDFLEVEAIDELTDVDDIAFDPVGGALYAIINDGGYKGKIVTINLQSGAVSPVGNLVDRKSQTVISDVEGLAFFNDGDLYGSTGKWFGDSNHLNALWRIDKNTGFVSLVGSFDLLLRDIEAVDCMAADDFLVLEKSTNGADSDSPPGPLIPVGEPVEWRYFVHNTGNGRLVDISVSDDNGTPDVPGDDLTVFCRDSNGTETDRFNLEPGQSSNDLGFVCAIEGVAGLGQFRNVGRVRAISSSTGNEIVSTDPGHYLGYVPPVVMIENRLTTPGAANPNVVRSGSEVTFTVRLTNSGQTALSVIPLLYEFDSTYLDFLRAEPAPDSNASASLRWSDLTGSGSLPASEGRALTLVFQARQSIAETVTLAQIADAVDVVGAPAAIVEDRATVRIVTPEILTTKSLQSPTNGVVPVRGLVTFTLSITNTGDTRLVSIPLFDEYEADHLEFIRTSFSEIPLVTITDLDADGLADDGRLLWENVTRVTGELVPNQGVHGTVTFRFTSEDDSVTTNVAQTGDVFDEFGFLVQPVGGVSGVSVTGDPTYVVLLQVRLRAGGQGVELLWQTGIEIGSYGFHLLRGGDGPVTSARQVTTRVIPARGGPSRGATYTFLDRTAEAGLQRYWIEELEFEGGRNRYGPFTIVVPSHLANLYNTPPLYLPRITP